MARQSLSMKPSQHADCNGRQTRGHHTPGPPDGSIKTLILTFEACERCSFLEQPCSLVDIPVTFKEPRERLHRATRWVVEEMSHSWPAYSLTTHTLNDVWEAAARATYYSQ